MFIQLSRCLCALLNKTLRSWNRCAPLMLRAGSGLPPVLTNLTLKCGKPTPPVTPGSPPVAIRFFSCGNKPKRMPGVCRLNVCLLKACLQEEHGGGLCCSGQHMSMGFWVLKQVVSGVQLGAPALGTCCGTVPTCRYMGLEPTRDVPQPELHHLHDNSR